MRFYGQSIRFLCSASASRITNWDPTVSLALEDATLLLLEKCSSRLHLKQILANMMRSSLIGKTFPMSRLLLFSAVSYPNNLDIAVLLFRHFTPHPNLYIYNTMISALSFSSSHAFVLYDSMLRSRICPDKQTFLSLLQASESLFEAKQIHCHAVIIGWLSYSYLQNSIIKLYLEKGEMRCAHQVFRHMHAPDVVSYNIMILGHAKKGYCLEALDLFFEMVRSGLEPDEYTMVGALMSCGRLCEVQLGKSLHATIERKKLIHYGNMKLANALLDMYVKCEELEVAQKLFDAMGEKDAISWNTIIAGYSKVRNLELAQAYFNAMPCRDLVSWNSLIAGYAQRGDFVMLKNLLLCMIAQKFCPDNVTVVNLLCAAAEVGALDQGRCIHGWVVRSQMKIDVYLSSALIDMYCKCGSLVGAFQIFECAKEKDVTLWTTMIAGFAFHGYGNKALELFNEMHQDVMPNKVTFVAVLTACTHSGLVNEGLRIFDAMKEIYGIEPGAEHYGCLVDVLGRSGRLLQAIDVIDSMPMKPTRAIWGAVLSACKAHGNVEIAEIAAAELLNMEPERAGGYVLLSSIFATQGSWKCSGKIREIMGSQGVKKTAGCSCLVVDGVLYEFVAADKRHSTWLGIHSVLNSLNCEMELGPDVM